MCWWCTGKHFHLMRLGYLGLLLSEADGLSVFHSFDQWMKPLRPWHLTALSFKDSLWRSDVRMTTALCLASLSSLLIMFQVKALVILFFVFVLDHLNIKLYRTFISALTFSKSAVYAPLATSNRISMHCFPGLNKTTMCQFGVGSPVCLTCPKLTLLVESGKFILYQQEALL